VSNWDKNNKNGRLSAIFIERSNEQRVLGCELRQALYERRIIFKTFRIVAVPTGTGKSDPLGKVGKLCWRIMHDE
jgi:hypothetical protein